MIPGTTLRFSSQCARNVEEFFKNTAIVYLPNPSKEAKFWWYATAVSKKKTPFDTTSTVQTKPLMLGREALLKIHTHTLSRE